MGKRSKRRVHVLHTSQQTTSSSSNSNDVVVPNSRNDTAKYGITSKRTSNPINDENDKSNPTAALVLPSRSSSVSLSSTSNKIFNNNNNSGNNHENGAKLSNRSNNISNSDDVNMEPSTTVVDSPTTTLKCIRSSTNDLKSSLTNDHNDNGNETDNQGKMKMNHPHYKKKKNSTDLDHNDNDDDNTTSTAIIYQRSMLMLEYKFIKLLQSLLTKGSTYLRLTQRNMEEWRYLEQQQQLSNYHQYHGASSSKTMSSLDEHLHYHHDHMKQPYHYGLIRDHESGNDIFGILNTENDEDDDDDDDSDDDSNDDSHNDDNVVDANSTIGNKNSEEEEKHFVFSKPNGQYFDSIAVEDDTNDDSCQRRYYTPKERATFFVEDLENSISMTNKISNKTATATKQRPHTTTNDKNNGGMETKKIDCTSSTNGSRKDMFIFGENKKKKQGLDEDRKECLTEVVKCLTNQPHIANGIIQFIKDHHEHQQSSKTTTTSSSIGGGPTSAFGYHRNLLSSTSPNDVTVEKIETAAAALPCDRTTTSIVTKYDEKENTKNVTSNKNGYHQNAKCDDSITNKLSLVDDDDKQHDDDRVCESEEEGSMECNSVVTATTISGTTTTTSTLRGSPLGSSIRSNSESMRGGSITNQKEHHSSASWASASPLRQHNVKDIVGDEDDDDEYNEQNLVAATRRMELNHTNRNGHPPHTNNSNVVVPHLHSHLSHPSHWYQSSSPQRTSTSANRHRMAKEGHDAFVHNAQAAFGDALIKETWMAMMSNCTTFLGASSSSVDDDDDTHEKDNNETPSAVQTSSRNKNNKSNDSKKKNNHDHNHLQSSDFAFRNMLLEQMKLAFWKEYWSVKGMACDIMARQLLGLGLPPHLLDMGYNATDDELSEATMAVMSMSSSSLTTLNHLPADAITTTPAPTNQKGSSTTSVSHSNARASKQKHSPTATTTPTSVITNKKMKRKYETLLHKLHREHSPWGYHHHLMTTSTASSSSSLNSDAITHDIFLRLAQHIASSQQSNHGEGSRLMEMAQSLMNFTSHDMVFCTQEHDHLVKHVTQLLSSSPSPSPSRHAVQHAQHDDKRSSTQKEQTISQTNVSCTSNNDKAKQRNNTFEFLKGETLEEYYERHLEFEIQY